MKLNVPRPIGPIRCIDAAGDPVLAPTVEISINDESAFVAATGTFDIIGDGYGVYNPVPADCDELGFVVVRISGTAQESTLREEVELRPEGIPAGTSDATLLHAGPMHLIAADGSELSSLVGVDVEVSINGSVWAAPTGALTLIEPGYGDYAIDPSEATAAGWLAVKAKGACQLYVFRVDIVAAPTAAAPTITLVSPLASTDPGEAGAFSASWSVARVTPIVIDIDSSDLDYACVAARFPSDVGVLERVVYRRDAYRTGFSVGSSAVHVTDSKLRLSILPDASWPSALKISELEIDVDATGSSELAAAASFTFRFPPDPVIAPVPMAAEFEDIPTIDPVALALARLPQQYRGEDDIPTELLV